MIRQSHYIYNNVFHDNYRSNKTNLNYKQIIKEQNKKNKKTR